MDSNFGSNIGALDIGRIVSVIGIIFCLVVICFLAFGCSTTDREMMEYENNGVYDCVVILSGEAYCK